MALDITLDLDPADEAALRAAAEREGLALGELVRQCLRGERQFGPVSPEGLAEAMHRRQQKRLLELAKNRALATGDLKRAFAAITEAAAETLEVERVGIWRYEAEQAAVTCADLYERSRHIHSAGTELKAQTYPVYFEAIAADRVLAVSDAQQDPRTRELRDSYLIPRGITSMLDASIQWGGRTIGIVCFEHVGPRRQWALEEESFAASIADMVALALEHAERKQAEDELLRRAIELDHQKELHRIKTNLINTVTHELRTPLTAIIGYLEFLSDELGGPLSAEQRAFVERIAQSASQLQRLVDDLLDFARLEAGTFRLVCRKIDLCQKIEEIVEAHRPQAAAKGLDLSVALPDAPLMAYQDPLRFGQVLSNLLSNAIKFTPEGGRIEVRLSETPEGARVEVSDTGIGVAPQHVPQLFERFFQVDSSSTRERAGAGLGLSIVKSLVELMGGELGVESELGEGSTFWFTLPLNRAVLLPEA
ncbi:GAF domain-containing protein [bacterium]|nr:GAF domain-containing protein [bacterium]